MQAILSGGPYDGVALDHNDINLYTRFVPVGVQKFIFLPPLQDWEAVRRGDVEKDGKFENDCPIYELVHTPKGIQGRYDPDGNFFNAAMKGESLGRHSAPEYEFTGLYFKCYRGDLRDVVLPKDHFSVIDEKNRKWECVAVSKEEGEHGGFGEMMSYTGGERLSAPLQMVILLCEDKSELSIKLADQID